MSISNKPLAGRDSVRVAIVQTAPVFLDLEKSIDKACEKIAEAADNGADMIAFSEVWLAGYPYWDEGWNTASESWAAIREKFYDNAMVIPSEQFQRLAEAAARANAVVTIGCNERDERPGKHSIYNSLLFINSDGSLIGKRRKLRPTFSEHAFWGDGPGDDLFTHSTAIGRLGGMICSEHLMTTVRARLIEQGEDFHIAVYPGPFDLVSGPRLVAIDETSQTFPGYASARAHAVEGGCFVVLALGYMTEDDIPADFPMRESLNIYAGGGSMVIGPAGIPLAGPVYGDEILYADCDASYIKLAKGLIDTNGTYSRPDLLTLQYHPRPTLAE